MEIKINDDIDLEKIMKSGQCFRVKEVRDGIYRFVHKEGILYINNIHDNIYNVTCDEAEWDKLWSDYFDLGRNYNDIYTNEFGKSDFIDTAMEYGKGLRILKQDPWEMMVSFIISQRKSIPAISTSIEKIAMEYGKRIDTDYESTYLFPTCEEMKDADESSLKACGLGYRAPYVLDATRRVLDGRLDLEGIADDSDEVLLEKLMSVHGIGKKVSNCIALFAYGRLGCVPVDVWIDRAIQEDCGGVSPFEMYGDNAGVIQQYVFYYKRNAR